MPTYSLSARNQFRSPSGAVGEAPDGPGGIAALRDDVDNFLGLGGAEYCANVTALNAIPASRLFVGKLAYRADLDTVFRYVGIGKTALAAGDSTSKWQAWEKPATPFTPTWTTGLTIGSSQQVAAWGISAGMAWLTCSVIAGANYALTPAGSEVAFTLPTPVLSEVSFGQGKYAPGGSGGGTVQAQMVIFAIGTRGQASTTARVRAAYVTATSAYVREAAPTSAGLTSAAGDVLDFDLRGPSALVA